MTRSWRILLVAIALPLATAIVLAVSPASAHVPSAPTTTVASSAPIATNDLLPQKDIDNCVGTLERANCGSRSRADGHTYLVFLALVLGMSFIGWRIARGVRARDAVHTSER